MTDWVDDWSAGAEESEKETRENNLMRRVSCPGSSPLEVNECIRDGC